MYSMHTNHVNLSQFPALHMGPLLYHQIFHFHQKAICSNKKKDYRYGQ